MKNNGMHERRDRPLLSEVAPDAPARTIREWRKEAFLSQVEFADALGVSASVLSLWERGLRHPQMRNLRHMAERLGIRPQQIRIETSESREQ